MSKKICVLGLGYVGLPLAVEFAKSGRKVIGFDVSEKRIAELIKGIDKTLEVDESLLCQEGLFYTSRQEEIKNASIYIVTVPTPINSDKTPNLDYILSASEMVGKNLSKGDIVIFESTVFPGCTRDYCVPILEDFSGLKFNRDFYCGYSPERMNPGDKNHGVKDIVKVTSGSTYETAQIVDSLYKEIVTAGTYLAPSIETAEAAKVIENSQRDINIAFVNELAMIFEKMGLDTLEVLKAASTKWNFLPFKPGLVGGHCIGVDPYYLTFKAQQLGYHPEMILAGRRLNDNMGAYIANRVVKAMIHKEMKINGAKVVVLGITFKENCPDVRNTRVVDIISELKDFGCTVEVYDPWADAQTVYEEYGLHLVQDLNLEDTKAVVCAVAHRQFSELELLKDFDGVLFDVKGILNHKQSLRI